MTSEQRNQAKFGLRALLVAYGEASQLARALDVTSASVRQWACRGCISVAGHKAVFTQLGPAWARLVRPDLEIKL